MDINLKMLISCCEFIIFSRDLLFWEVSWVHDSKSLILMFSLQAKKRKLGLLEDDDISKSADPTSMEEEKNSTRIGKTRGMSIYIVREEFVVSVKYLFPLCCLPPFLSSNF